MSGHSLPLLSPQAACSMASAEHPGSPGWTGRMAHKLAGAKQRATASGPDLPSPGPEGDSGELEAWGLVRGTEVCRHLKCTCRHSSRCHQTAGRLP